MWLVPYKKFIVVTPMPPEEVQKKLSAQMIKYPGFFKDLWDSPRRDIFYFGEVKNNRFSFHRRYISKNHSPHTVNGTIEPFHNGSKLNVVVSVRKYYSIVVAILSCVLFIVALMAIIGDGSFLLVLSFLVFYGSEMMDFYDDLKDGKDLLCDALDGKIETAE